MSISDDPRAFRRGQQGGHYPAQQGRGDDARQPARHDPRGGPRPAPARSDDRFPSSEAPQRQQSSFSAYRPEAYANEKRGGSRPDWDNGDPRNQARPAPEPFRPAPAAAEHGRSQHDPYQGMADDPYDPGSRDFDNSWRGGYQDARANQFPSSGYYAHHDEPNPGDAQSVHDRFFAPEPEPERATPPSQPAPRYHAPEPDYSVHEGRNGHVGRGSHGAQDFSAHDFGGDEHAAPRGGVNSNFDEPSDFRWDSFDQPKHEPARGYPNAKGGHDDLDADYFADEDEFEGEDDYHEAKKGGSKKLMAAVLVGAVVTGGGLAYLYKSQTGGDAGDPPIMTADTRPVKEVPDSPGGREFPNGGKMIYDRLENAGGAEEPRRIEANDVPGVVTTGASGTLEERIQSALRDAKRGEEPPAAGSTLAAAQQTPSPDTPRAVRTEIIRPDGSTEPSRVQRRQAPPSEGGEVSLAGAPRGVVSREAPPPAAAPAPRPQVAAATPAAVSQPAVSSGGESGLFVQIAARNDQAAAMAAFADLQQKYASVLGNHSPSVRKVDLGDKGVWYRLLVGPMASKPEADKLCEDLKTAGMKGCFSRKE